MPSWVEEMAQAVECPTCQAPEGEPCHPLRGGEPSLEFNHPSRNHRFHLFRAQDRARARRAQPTTDGDSAAQFGYD